MQQAKAESVPANADTSGEAGVGSQQRTLEATKADLNL